MPENLPEEGGVTLWRANQAGSPWRFTEAEAATDMTLPADEREIPLWDSQTFYPAHHLERVEGERDRWKEAEAVAALAEKEALDDKADAEAQVEHGRAWVRELEGALRDARKLFPHERPERGGDPDWVRQIKERTRELLEGGLDNG